MSGFISDDHVQDTDSTLVFSDSISANYSWDEVREQVQRNVELIGARVRLSKRRGQQREKVLMRKS